MQPTHYAIAAGLIIAIVLIAVRTWWLRSVTFGQGYDAGYADAAKGHVHTITDLREHVSALQQDIAGHTRSRRSQAEIHQRALDTVMQDADTRIAIYARRANPFTAEDRITLQATASQLDVAANTYAGLQADDQSRFALQMKRRVLELAERLHATLLASGQQETTRPLQKSHLVHGPQACGKTTNARAIAAVLGLSNILDDWHPGMPYPAEDTLVLTNHAADCITFIRSFKYCVLTYEQAMQAVELATTKAAA